MFFFYGEFIELSIKILSSPRKYYTKKKKNGQIKLRIRSQHGA